MFPPLAALAKEMEMPLATRRVLGRYSRWKNQTPNSRTVTGTYFFPSRYYRTIASARGDRYCLWFLSSAVIIRISGMRACVRVCVFWVFVGFVAKRCASLPRPMTIFSRSVRPKDLNRAQEMWTNGRDVKRYMVFFSCGPLMDWASFLFGWLVRREELRIQRVRPDDMTAFRVWVRASEVQLNAPRSYCACANRRAREWVLLL